MGSVSKFWHCRKQGLALHTTTKLRRTVFSPNVLVVGTSMIVKRTHDILMCVRVRSMCANGFDYCGFGWKRNAHITLKRMGLSAHVVHTHRVTP